MVHRTIFITYDECDVLQKNDHDLQLMNNMSSNIINLIINLTIMFENTNTDMLYDIFKKYFQNLPPTLEKLIINLHVVPYEWRIYVEQINKDKLYNCIKIPFNCDVHIGDIAVSYPY